MLANTETILPNKEKFQSIYQEKKIKKVNLEAAHQEKEKKSKVGSLKYITSKRVDKLGDRIKLSNEAN